MKIEHISIEGFRDLKEIYEKEESSMAFSAMSGGLGQKGSQILGNIRISMRIVDLSLMEAIHLKKIASTYEGTQPYVKYEIEGMDGDVQAEIFTLQSILDAVDKDADVKDMHTEYRNHILPLVCQRIDANVTFTGYSIMEIIGMDGKALFINNSSIGDKMVYDEARIIDMITKWFVKRFFEGLSRTMTLVDRDTEFFLQRKYFTPARTKYGEDKTKCAQLISVTSPAGSFSLRYDSMETITTTAKQIKAFMENQKTHSLNVTTKPNHYSGYLEAFRMEFSVIMNVYEALLLQYRCPELISSMENLALQVGDGYIEMDPNLIEKYRLRISEPINKILSYRNEVDDVFAHYNLIFGGQIVAMNLSIPCIGNSDLDDGIKIRSVDWSALKTEGGAFAPILKEIKQAHTMIMNIIETS